ncbi:MAG: MerR family transcriptional regulator [Deltaproteobacteria bacterium]|nr:MAG: MerR family transcriptional regulator [Deltaproteobacteria bacterium]
MREFTKKHLEEILGLKRGTVDHYYREELVKPEIDDPTGRGTRRRYSARNLIEFAMIRELVASGIPIKKIKQLFVEARKLGAVEWFDPNAEWLKKSRVLLVVFRQGEPVFEFNWRSDAVTLDRVMKGRTSATIIDVSAIAGQLKEFIT